MRPMPLGLEDKEGDEEPMDIGNVPPPTQSVDPHVPSSSRVASPSMDTSSIPRL